MPRQSPKKADELLDLFFLEMRSHLLETAAALDRIERADGFGEVKTDERLGKLTEALDILKRDGAKRAEEFLLLFSDPAPSLSEFKQAEGGR